MIRYPISEPDLRERIEAASPGWLAETAQRTESFRGARRYTETNTLWGKVKSVYARLQRNKCAYCERRLPGSKYGSGEQHVDHYRPKGSVKIWPPARSGRRKRVSFDFSTGDALAAGYYLLAYHPFNYALACYSCNSSLKGSYFPVEGSRNGLGENPRELASELPLLPYPLGDFDDDPEELLTFLGATCKPVASSGRSLRRAQVTIEFFALNEREELRRSRAETLRNVQIFLQTLDNPLFNQEDRELADQRLRETLAPQSEHSSCARSFRRLYEEDPQLARELADKAQVYIDSES